jgi:hypothetical protein
MINLVLYQNQKISCDKNQTLERKNKVVKLQKGTWYLTKKKNEKKILPNYSRWIKQEVQKLIFLKIGQSKCVSTMFFLTERIITVE